MLKKVNKIFDYSRLSIFSLILLLIISFTTHLSLSETSYRADWLHKAKWGVFVHYLAEDNLPVRDWNNRVSNFDVKGVARQLHLIGARYYVITLGQNSGYYCSPNITYDKYVEINPSKCSSRDLISDLYKELEPFGIKLMVYLTAGAPSHDKTAVSKLEWTNGPERNDEFQNKWEDVIREWSLRWGSKVKGWWFDGCYWPNQMYGLSKPPNFKSFAESARAGNPKSIIAFNQGPIYPIPNPTEYADYTAGEVNDPRGIECNGQLVSKTQLHVLSFLGSSWGRGNRQFTDDEVIRTTQNILKCGGAITWDVPILNNGLIADQFAAQLLKLNQNLDKPLLPLQKKPVPKDNLASFKKAEFLNLGGNKKLPVNSAKYFPAWGVDGNLETFAIASDEWAWTYQVDLSKVYTVKTIVINFGITYSTEYKILVSIDGKIWSAIIHNINLRGAKKNIHNLSPTNVRYIQVKSIKPDAPNQVGTQMSIAEIEVYK